MASPLVGCDEGQFYPTYDITSKTGLWDWNWDSDWDWDWDRDTHAIDSLFWMHNACKWYWNCCCNGANTSSQFLEVRYLYLPCKSPNPIIWVGLSAGCSFRYAA